MEKSNLRKRMPISSLADPKIIGPAFGSAFRKLDPRVMVRNPVMFVVEVVAALTTVLFLRDLAVGGGNLGFTLQIVLWLWFTILFANFSEAVAEGRGKAQADTLRRTRSETKAKLFTGEDRTEYRTVPGTSLKVGDVVLVEAGDIIPSDGEVIEGVASVNEAAITGESAPVIRESGGDRSAVTGGTQVLSDSLLVRVTAAPGSTFLDRMIRLVEGAERQKTPNEIALNVLLAGLTLTFLIAVASIPAFTSYAGGTIAVPILGALFVALSSAAANNGSGFEGLGDNTLPWNVATGLVMLFARFIPIILPLAIVGSLAAKRRGAESAGTLGVEDSTFAGMLLATILVMGALTFFPAATLGPRAEHFIHMV